MIIHNLFEMTHDLSFNNSMNSMVTAAEKEAGSKRPLSSKVVLANVSSVIVTSQPPQFTTSFQRILYQEISSLGIVFPDTHPQESI